MPAGNGSGAVRPTSQSRTRVTVFNGKTVDDKQPSKTIKNSVNRSQIFYSDRQDTFYDQKSKRMDKHRNDSSIGRMDVPDAFEAQASRGRNHMT